MNKTASARIIADFAALLPFAHEACAAIETKNEAKLLHLFCGESQRRTLRRLKQLIEDLRLCKSVDDLPGSCPEVIELRNTSFKVFRGLSARAGDPMKLVKSFRIGAVDFFQMITRRDPAILWLVHNRHCRDFAFDNLSSAMKACQFILQLRQMPVTLLHPLLALIRTIRDRLTKNPRYEVSVADAAISLDISERTVANWDRDGCPLDKNYPGRFNAVTFYQWAVGYKSKQRFAREAKKRAILINIERSCNTSATR